MSWARPSVSEMTKGKDAEGIQASGFIDEAKTAVVYQRYCHVYREEELRGLFHATEMCEIEEVYTDTGNLCCRAVRI